MNVSSPASEEQQAVAGTAYIIFARMWALAGVFHFISFHGWRWNSWQGLILGALTLGALFRPTTGIFVGFVLLDWLYVGWQMPMHPNHIIFSWVVNLTLLITYAIQRLRIRSGAEMGGDWFRLFAPWLRVEFCVLYFFAVFHKLNVAYFDPEISSAATMLREIGARFPMIPTWNWAQALSIYGTLACETAIPLLLMYRPTRGLGLLLGIGFHGALSLHFHGGIFSFSVTMLAMFSLFLPASLFSELRLLRWGTFALNAVAGVLSICFVILGSGRFFGVNWILAHWRPENVKATGYWLALGYILGAFCVAAWLAVRKRSALTGVMLGSLRSCPALAIFPSLLLIIGLQPYLGLRTQGSFSMFSNLHTEGGQSNHLLMPEWVQLTDWQHDLVEIIPEQEAHPNHPLPVAQTIPFHELRRIRTNIGWANFQFRRNGQEFHYLANDPITHASIPPCGPIARRYFWFRPVSADPKKVPSRH
jgi:hypothetical protein